MRFPRSEWSDELAAVLKEAAVSPGYVTRHLLSIGTFSEDVLGALSAGLPLSICRLVNGLDREEDREAALSPLWSAVRPVGRADSPLLPRGVAKHIERLARRLRALQAAGGGSALPLVSQATLADGWLLPFEPMAPARGRAGDTWIYPAPSRAARRAESLPGEVVEWLIARYLVPGDRLVDVTAGGGTIGDVASRHGIASWSGDVAPGAPFVHRVDARELMLGEGLEDTASPAPGSSQALVLHPPTYPAWLDSLDDRARRLATIDQYSEEVAAMLAGASGVLVSGGVAMVITRPVRANGRAWLVTSHLSEVIVEFGMSLVGYHVAVAEDGSEDWHVLVGEVERAA